MSNRGPNPTTRLAATDRFMLGNSRHNWDLKYLLSLDCRCVGGIAAGVNGLSESLHGLGLAQCIRLFCLTYVVFLVCVLLPSLAVSSGLHIADPATTELPHLLNFDGSPLVLAKKAGDQGGRYQWLFRRDDEQDQKTASTASMLEKLDNETKEARRLYLSGEAENGILKYRNVIDLLESALNDTPAGHPFLQDIAQRAEIFDELAAKILGPVHLEAREEVAGNVFHLLEKRRAFARNLILKKAQIPRFLGVDQNLRQSESTILEKLLELRQESPTRANRRKEETLRSELAEVRKSLLASSQVYAFLIKGTASSLTEVRRGLLTDEEMILDFTLLTDRMAVGVITKESALYHQVPADPTDIAKAVFLLQDKLQEHNRGAHSTFMGHAWKEPCRRIYRKLLGGIPPVDEAKTKVFIIPDGPLWYLPFSAILDPEDRPLGKDRVVSLIQSVETLKFIRSAFPRDIKEAPARGLLLVESIPYVSEEDLAQGPQVSPSGKKGARKLSESERIEKLILANPVYPKPSEVVLKSRRLFQNAKVLAGPAAAFDRVLQQKREQEDVTLLAVPLAVTDQVSGDTQPSWFFAPDKRGRRKVYVRDLFGLSMKSRITVLPISWFHAPGKSKCLGEGPVLLTTAMLYAGVPATLVNYSNPNWGEDEPYLLELLRKIAEGSSPGRALADYVRTMQSVLDSSFAGKPPAWAGWILVGDPGN